MYSVRPQRASAYWRIAFARPLFDWRNVPRQFFESLYDALSPRLAVSAADFSVQDSYSLNEVSARYRVFGGANAIVLSAQQLALEFPDLVRDDYGLAVEIAQAVDYQLEADFSQCGRATMRFTLHEHLDFLGPGQAEDYLARYAIASLESAFGPYAGPHRLGAMFSTTDAGGRWQARCQVERSEARDLDNAVFLTRDVTLLSADQSLAPGTGLALIWEVAETCARALDLEVSHA